MKRIKINILKVLLIGFIMTNLTVVPCALAAGITQSGIIAAKAEDKKDEGTIRLSREKREILIKYKNESKAESIKSGVKKRLKLGKLELKKKAKQHRMELLEIGEKDNIESIINELKSDPNVEYAQPNYKLEIAAVEDSMFNMQWSLKNTAQEVQGITGRAGVDINAETAWSISQGSPDVVVGVLDTGIDINHGDLEDSIYSNPNEIENDGVDNDNNGFIDDVNGWDFVNDDSTVYDDSVSDLHGTYVSGIIAAKGDTEGIRGVAPNVKLLPLKFINGNSGYTCDAIDAIEYAYKMGVKIMNCSFGGSDNNPALKDVMQNSGMLFICAAGNRGADSAVSPVYPACFDIANVLSVAAIDNNGMKASFSSYGSNIHVAAPGVSILSTVPDNGYDYISGTSVAVPHVTGIAALLKSQSPNISFSDISARIKNNVVACASLQGKLATSGRVEANAALTNTPPAPDSTPPTEDSGEPGEDEEEPDDDSLYTMEQLALINDQIHYGESGINPAIGNFSFTCNDMNMNSPGFQINVSRTYNSKDDYTLEKRNRHLGKGWSFGFEGNLNNLGFIKIALPNGSIQTFKSGTGNSYIAENSRSTLVKNADGTHTLTTKDQYKYGFSKEGWLVSMTDKSSNTISISVNASTGKVNTITDAVGRIFTVAYNGNGLISTITDPMGRAVKYEYDSSKRLVKVTDPANNVMKYGYDSKGCVDKIFESYKAGGTESTNLLSSLIYDHSTSVNQEKVKQATDAYGNTYTYTYDLQNRKTVITDSNGRQSVYFFDSSNYLSEYQDEEGRRTLTVYDVDQQTMRNKYGEVKSTTDRNGNITHYTRDNRGNITKITYYTNQGMITKEYAYDDKNNLIQEKDELGKLTFYVYNANNTLKRKAQPLNGTDIYQDGISDQNKFAITTYEYYEPYETGNESQAKGLVKTVKDPEGNITTYRYDGNGYANMITDPENKSTVDTYNKIGWKLSSTTPKQYKTDYVYDSNGLLEKMIQHGGEITRITYDVAGRKTKEIAPNLYNPNDDNLENHSYTGDYGTRYEYFFHGKIKNITDAEGNKTSYTYDKYGNVATETKPNGAIYIYDYDVLNRLKKVSFKSDAGATPTVLEEYSYAVLSNHNTQKTHIKYLNSSEKAVTVYIYDYAERLIEQQNPDGSIIKTGYNSNGTIATTTDGMGNITYYEYDGLNRLSKKWVPFELSGGAIKYAYTETEYFKNGNKMSESAGVDTVDLFAIPSKTVTTSYIYYKNGKLKSVTDSSGRRTDYAIDDDGNISCEEVYTGTGTNNVTEYEYNHLGKVTRKKVQVRAGDIAGNDFTSDYNMYLFTEYTYDKNGNVKTMETPDNVITTYTYDNLNRQTGATWPGIDETGAAVDIITETTYDWEGKVLTSKDARGNITTFTYDKRGFQVKVEDTNHGVTFYGYDTAGRKILEISPENYNSSKTSENMNRVEYVYDSMGRMVRKLDKYLDPITNQWMNIVSRTLEYDANGNVMKEQDALGYENGYGTVYSYNLANKLSTVLDPVSEERSLSFTTKYEYDGLGRKLSETNAKGVSTLYIYDDAGNITSVSVKKPGNEPAKVLKERTYDQAGNIRTEKDGNKNETKFEYTALNKVRKIVSPGDSTIDSNTIISQYDEMGNLALRKDNLGKVSLYTYDHEGRVLTQSEQREDGTESITVVFRYDVNGNKRFETDGNGNTTESGYDALNRLAATTVTVSGVVQTTLYEYDKNGNQTRQTDWRGNTYLNAYDPMNRLIEKKDPFGKVIQKLRYFKNNVQSESYDALGNETQYLYDRNNRLVKTVDPEGHTISQTYDDVGNIDTKKDGMGNTQTFEFDEFNRLKTVTNAKGETTSFTYDLNGNMLSQTDGKGNKATFVYNVANKMIKRIDPYGKNDPAKIESYTYFADGSLRTKKDRNGNTTQYTYDIHGRLLSQSIGSNTISYTYDNNGNQLTMTDATGITVRTYDELNRVLEKTVPNIGTSTFEYDIVEGVGTGEKAETSTDPLGNTTKKVFDRAGRLKTVTSDGDTVTYTYYDNGSRKSVAYPDGSKEEYTYYSDGLNHTLTNKKANGSIIETYVYTYDGAHNQITKKDAKGTTYYTYDRLNRLETVTEPGDKITVYTYDAAGNRLTETVTQNGRSTVTGYEYNDQNRLLKTETVSEDVTENVVYAYDANGNMLSSTKETLKTAQEGQTPSAGIYRAGSSNERYITFYRYDVWNQMVKSITGDKTVTMTYNGDGQRVEKTVNGEITRYLYEYDDVVLEADGTGSQKAKNVYGLNLLMRNVEGESYYYMYNGHADVTALMKSDGTIAATYYYDAFGNITEQTGDVNNNITFAGYQYDSETGLYYLNSRMYDPKIARFLQEDTYRGDPNDPLSLNLYTYCHNEPPLCFLRGTNGNSNKSVMNPQSLNLYAYCHNDPIGFSDPTGHTEEKDAFIFDKSTKDNIQKATDAYNQAAKDYKNGKISQAEMKSRQADAHQDAVDARTAYAKDHTIYANITVSVEKGKNVYTMNGGEQYLVVGNNIQLKPTNNVNAYKGDVDKKSGITISTNIGDPYDISKYVNGKYDRTASVAYATNPSYSSPGKGNPGLNADFFETKNKNPNYIRFDNLNDKGTVAATYNSFGVIKASDCGNFTSQALAAGGVKGTKEWHYNGINSHSDEVCTPQWSSVRSQYDYFSNPDNGYVDGDVLEIESYEEMQLYVNSEQMRGGDLLYWESADEGIHHSTMVTGFNQNGEILYSGHSIDRINQPVIQDRFTVDNQTLRVVRINDYAFK